VPRRLSAPDPPLADDRIRLEPLTQADHDALLAMIQDEEVKRFTLVPTNPEQSFVRGWIGRYERGWEDASCAGFSIRDADDGAFLGFAAIVQLDLDARQGEIGYALPVEARGRGAATGAVALLTDWAFDELHLERLELRIDVTNAASTRIAERNGYRLDGVLRSLHFKERRRTDTAVWSRLRLDSLPV
jgi:ribosomal-protein-alanine N-acetyltransferase